MPDYSVISLDLCFLPCLIIATAFLDMVIVDYVRHFEFVVDASGKAYFVIDLIEVGK